MKTHHITSLALAASLLAAISTNANAAVLIVTADSTSNTGFDANISSTDLINQGQATFLSSSTSEGVTFGGAGAGNDGSASGNNNNVYDNNSSGTLTLTYNLNVSVNTLGYDINSIQTIYGWSTGPFAEQLYSIEYATVASPSTFNPLTSVDFQPDPARAATQVTITEDASGVLASGVSSIRFILTMNPDNNQVGIARELDVFGTATVVPEPSVALLGGIGLLALLRRRRD